MANYGNSFTELDLTLDTMVFNYGSPVVYINNTWNYRPKFLYFINGADISNINLISWLESNGTLSNRANNLGNLLTDIADSIRDNQKLSGSINAQNFPEEISNATKPASLANIIRNDPEATAIPFVSAAGRVTTDMKLWQLTIPSAKTLNTLYNSGTVSMIINPSGGTISSLSNSGSLSAMTNSGITALLTNSGEITEYRNTALTETLINNGAIGNGTPGAEDSGEIYGRKGLYGTGTVYVAATADDLGSSSTYKLSNITLKGGSSTTYQGSYLDNLNVNTRATIGNLNNTGVITNFYGTNGSIANYSGSQYIEKLGCLSGTATSGKLFIKRLLGNSGIPYAYLLIGENITGSTADDELAASLRIYNPHDTSDETTTFLTVHVNSGKNLKSLDNSGTTNSIINNGTVNLYSNFGTTTSVSNDSGYNITQLNNLGTIGDITNYGSLGVSHVSGGTTTMSVYGDGVSITGYVGTINFKPIVSSSSSTVNINNSSSNTILAYTASNNTATLQAGQSFVFNDGITDWTISRDSSGNVTII